MKWDSRWATSATTPRLLVAGFAWLLGAIAADRLQGQEPGGPHLGLPQVLEAGADGPTLLLIPCAGCGARSWDRFMEVNRDRFQMIAVTLPGYDASPRPDLPLWTGEPVFQRNALDRLVELVEERGLQEVVAVGQSFGATMALRLATKRPEAIRAVVAVDGAPTNAPERATRSAEERLAEARETVDEDWALRLQDPEEYRSFNAARSLPDSESRLLHHGMFMGTDRVSMLHYWRENILQDRNPDFVGLHVPYLDIDAISPRVEHQDSAAAAHIATLDRVGRPAGYRLVRFWRTSHWVHVERPDELGRTILDFLGGRPLQDVGEHPGSASAPWAGEPRGRTFDAWPTLRRVLARPTGVRHARPQSLPRVQRRPGERRGCRSDRGGARPGETERLPGPGAARGARARHPGPQTDPVAEAPHGPRGPLLDVAGR